MKVACLAATAMLFLAAGNPRLPGGETGKEQNVPQAQIRVDPKKVVNPDFLGFGFHVFFPMHVKQLTPRIKYEVLHKRWLELRPSFARMTHEWSRGEAGEAELVDAMKMMQRCGTAVYLTTWDPKATPPGAEREAYARQVVDMLERLRQQGCSNLRWYCLTNELQMTGDLGNGVKVSGWAALRPHLEVFRDYHRLFHAELARRRLDIGLLATDASAGLGLRENQWARQNMDDISAAYGGHDYFNRYDVKDLTFYGWFLDQCRQSAQLAHPKPFLMGEFGPKQHGGARDGFKRWDGCAYFDTPQEPLLALQVAEAVLAAVKGGVDALAYWTFSDFPDDYSKTYANKWGVSRWSGDDHSTRDFYYGVAHLTRNFRGPAAVLQVESSDANVRAAAVRQPGGACAMAVVNRHPARVPVRIALGEDSGKPFRKYVYDSSAPPRHPFGDLPAADAVLEARAGELQDSLPPLSLTVYTTDYDTQPPAKVEKVETAIGADGQRVLRWSPVRDADPCYYRVFHAKQQLGSTVATEFALPPGVEAAKLRVIAVDTSGNASREGE